MSLVDLTKLQVAGHTDRFQLSPRRRLWVSPAATTLNASGITGCFATLTLTDTLGLDDGLQFDYLWTASSFGGGPTVGALTITDWNVWLANTAVTNFILPLGGAALTTLTPTRQLWATLPPIPLMLARDIDAIVRANGSAAGLMAPGVQPLSIRFNMDISNSTAVATYTATQTIGVFYRVINGLEEG